MTRKKTTTKKKVKPKVQEILKNEETSGRRSTRQSMAAAVTPKTISKSPTRKYKLSKADIEKEIMGDPESDNSESMGKHENDNNNLVEDDCSITVKIRRMSDQNYKVVEYKIGMKKKDNTPAKLTGTAGRTRNRKSNYKSLQEDKLQQSYKDVSHKNIQDVPKTPTKRRPNGKTKSESSTEVDENVMLNANLSPKRSKIVGATPKNLQIDTPRNRRSVKPSLETNIEQSKSKQYDLRKKRSEAIYKSLYTEYSSNSESGDDGDNNYNVNNDSESSEDEDDESAVSDNSEIYSPKKSKNSKKLPALMKTPSKSNLRTPSKVSMDTPTKLLSRMNINSLTPSVHRRTMNIAKPSTPLQEARQKLHVSVLPKSLPCREEEFNNIYSFLNSRLSDLSGGCIYVSGVPGTGKTATVNEVIRCLKKSMNAGKLDEFEFVEINGMKLSEPRQAYVQIWKQLSGNQTTWEDAQKSLHNRFTTANSKRGMTLLLVDELDLLCTKRQDVVYNLLDWPSKSTAKLVVVTIANTMDLPERILMGKVTSRLGLTRLTFPPYNHKQLEEIVVSRLKGHNAFSGETVQLVARKVAAVSGDARRALDICRRATEVAEMNDREMVTMMDVKQALDEMIASPKIQAIKACSDLEKIFLQAVCSEVNRTGVEEVLFKNVYYQLETLCLLEGEKVPNVTEALTMCARLGSWRLLLCDHSRLDIHQRLLLNVSTDDVYFAIKNAGA